MDKSRTSSRLREERSGFFFPPLTLVLPFLSFLFHPPPPPPPPPTHTHTHAQSIAPTAEEEEELDACDAWVAALVDAEIADEQQEAFHLESENAVRLAEAFSASASVVSVR